MATRLWIRSDAYSGSEWCDILCAQLDGISAKYLQRCQILDDAILNWKPSPDRWSVAEILSHLVQVNTSYYPILDKALSGTLDLPWHARAGFLTRWFARLILKSTDPENRKNTRTFPVWQPAKSELGKEVLSRFLAEQSILKRYIEKCIPLMDKGVVIYSPASRSIVYPLVQAFRIIGLHEERHFRQMESVLASRVEASV